MALSDFMQKYWWKNLVHKLYSWGASIVLVGALFKITHWPGATIMLTVGLLTEALIFVISGIEPPHEELDWTLVYPELKVSEEDGDILTSGSGRNKNQSVQTGASLSVDSITKFDQMLEKAGGDNLFEKLGEGLTKMTENVNNLNDITDASVATNEFTKNIKNASESVNNLSETYSKTASDFTAAAGNLEDTFKSSVDTINYSVGNLTDSFSNVVSSMDLDFSSLSEGNKEYNDKISMLNKNLSAINAIFEMQLGEANLEDMVKDVQESAVYAKKYSQEITNLSKNLSALNNVYGNMLSAMNVKLD